MFSNRYELNVKIKKICLIDVVIVYLYGSLISEIYVKILKDLIQRKLSLVTYI